MGWEKNCNNYIVMAYLRHINEIVTLPQLRQGSVTINDWVADRNVFVSHFWVKKHSSVTHAVWFRRAVNPNVSTGSLARPFARWHCSLFRSLYPACFTRVLHYTHPYTRSLTHSLRVRGKANDLMSQNDLVLSHRVMCALKPLYYM